MHYLWLTDIHLNFLSKPEIRNFATQIRTRHSKGIVITGDISTGKSLIEDLSVFLEEVGCPVYFVLGNHDFYRSSFQEMEAKVQELCFRFPNAHYLSSLATPIALSSDTALVGQDGWYDARWAEPLTRLVFASDFFWIKDFRALFSYAERLSLVRDLAYQQAEQVSLKLKPVLKQYQTVYLATHVPPWPEAILYQKSWWRKFWLPYCTSKIMAENLKNLMIDFPNKRLIVLSGHTHCRRSVQISRNIEIEVGGAALGRPKIQDYVITVHERNNSCL